MVQEFDENGATNLQISLGTILFEMVLLQNDRNIYKNFCVWVVPHLDECYEAISGEELDLFQELVLGKNKFLCLKIG